MAYDLEQQPGAFALTRGAKKMRVAGVYLVLGIVAALVALLLLVSGTYGFLTAAALLAAGFIAKLFFEDAIAEATPWVKGGNAEAAVGDLLAELRRERFVVMHDLEHVVGGNVDHVVAGSTGVFMVETKFRRYEDRDLGKAKRVAATIGHELGVRVTPVICVAKREYGPRSHRGVAIVGKHQLLPYIRSQRNPPADFERLVRFADRQ